MPKGKNKHLTIQDRIEIQKGIESKDSFAAIARAIGVSTSTISREVWQNRELFIPKGAKFNTCAHKRDCALTGICGPGCSLASCRKCPRVRCNEVCVSYEEHSCDELKRAPFVCGDCYRRSNCGFRHARYQAVSAQQSYELRLVKTREGISLTPEELASTIKAAKDLLSKGQSFEAICAAGDPRIKVSPRTLYRYAEAGVFGIANIDLPKKVRYKPRKSRHRVDRPIDRQGRSYADYLELPEDIRARAVQMDTVIGVVGDFKCILTLHFPAWAFQVYILLDEHTCNNVIGALDWLETLCEGKFSECFPAMLTDRGIEFGDFDSLEKSCLGPQRRTRIYYCDAMASHQKGACEKNHVELRKILPKKTSFEALTPHDMAVIGSHVNSYPRKSLGGATPYSLAAKALPKALLDGLGISRVPPSKVTLKPSLIKHA